jgi:hypothetical protein
VVKVDVAQKNVTNVFCIESRFPKIADDIVEGRFRPGIEEHDSIIRFQRGCGHDSGVPELTCIKDMDQGRIRNYELRRILFRSLQNRNKDSGQFVRFLAQLSEPFSPN